MVAEPGDGFGEAGHRVLGVGQRAVPGAAARGELHPRHAAFGGLDRVEPQVGGHGDGEPADLADPLGAALEPAGMVVDEPAGALSTAGLLVGDEGKDEITGRRAPRARPVADDREGHRVHVLHVDRAAAPEASVADLSGERVDRPVVLLSRYDVQMPVNEQRRPVRVGPGDAGEDARPTGF